jgi:hypothetical protein
MTCVRHGSLSLITSEFFIECFLGKYNLIHFLIFYFNRNEQKVYCVALLSHSSEGTPSFLFDPYAKAKLIKQIKRDEFLSKNARFMTLYHNIQKEFVDKLRKAAAKLAKLKEIERTVKFNNFV